jgi:hypothetical protein
MRKSNVAFDLAPIPDREGILQMRWWSVQCSYSALDDNAKRISARFIFHTEASDIPGAYANAVKEFGDRFRYGAIVPGRHSFIP